MSIDQIRSLRSEATGLLNIVKNFAIGGEIDPNMVFNAACDASNLELSALSAQLHALATQLKPTGSHNAALFDLENKLGISYSMAEEKLVRSKLKPNIIREKAISSIQDLVRQGRQQQSEIVLSRAWNVAERNRGSGGFDDLIRAITDVTGDIFSAEFQLPTSYYGSALFHALVRRGTGDWKNEAIFVLRASLKVHAAESLESSWHKPAIRELTKNSHEAGIIDDFFKICKEVKHPIVSETNLG